MQRTRFAAKALLTALTLLVTVPAAAQDFDAEGEAAMLAALNARRADAGLAPLARDARLDAAARGHAAYMAEHDALAHVTDDTGTPADRVLASGVTAAEIAENVAMHHTAAEAQQSLELSAPHLGNMLSARFTHVGIGVVRDERGVYATQVFARIDATPPAPPEAAEPLIEESAPVVDAPPPTTSGPIVAPQIVVPLDPGAGASTPPPPAPGYGWGGQAAPAPGAPVTVTVPRPDGRPLAGYWICHAGRWWYYPMPPNAAPGQHLQPDLRVTGAPPGYATQACSPASPVVTIPRSSPPIVMPPPPPPPRVVIPAPPPRREPRVIYVAPAPGTVIAPYGYGVQVELGVGVGPVRGRVRGRVRVRGRR